MKNIKRIIVALLIVITVAGTMTVAFARAPIAFFVKADAPLRAEPDMNSKKLTTIPERTIFYAVNDAEDDRGVTWYYGQYKGKEGWVSSKKLKKYNGDATPKPTKKPTPTPKPTKKPTPKPTKKPTPTPVPTKKPINYNAFRNAGYYVMVTANSLNLRNAPSTDYSTIREYGYGDVLYAIRTNGSWYEVLDEDRKVSGYMSAKYLVRCAAPTAYTEPTVPQQQTILLPETLPEGYRFFTLHGTTTDWDALNRILTVASEDDGNLYTFICAEDMTVNNVEYTLTDTPIVVFYAAASEYDTEELQAYVID